MALKTLPNIGLWQFVVGLVAGLLLYNLCLSVYRLTIHPLAKYPGPFFSKISELAIVFQAVSGHRHLEHLKEHEKYGSIVRIGPNVVSINTITAIKEIYGNRRANVQKSEWYRTIDANSGDFSTHSEIDRTKHAARRRVLDHAFSDSALRSTERFIVENVRTFCGILASGTGEGITVDTEKKVGVGEWSAPFDMAKWSTYLNYDIMGDLVFGKRFNCMTSKENRFVPELLMTGTQFVYVVAYLPFASLVRALLASPILTWVGGQMARDELAYVEYANTQVSQRIAVDEEAKRRAIEKPESEAEARKDFMYYLLSARDPNTNEGFTRQQLNADSSLLIAAGADTTSTTFSAAIFYLLHYPRVLATLRQEVLGAFPTIEDVRATPGSALPSLPYLRAFIDETLRMASAAPTHLPRLVLKGGLTLSTGEVFPEGTIVGVSAYAIHHNPEYYPDPFTFWPERWIVDNSAHPEPARTPAAVKQAKDAFFAFSLGSRGCVGRSVAYMELQITLARVLWLFDMREAQGRQDKSLQKERKHPLRNRDNEYQITDCFIAARAGPVVEWKVIEGKEKFVRQV